MWAALAALLFGASASAAPPGVTLHEGWLFRVGLGVGYNDTAFEPSGLSMHGVSMASNLVLGGYVIPNLALHATLWNGIVFSPSVSGGSVDTGGVDITLSSTGIGAGATYVLPSIDLFASVSFGASTLTGEAVSGPYAIYVTNFSTGFGFNAIVGKTFRTDGDWSFGVAAQFMAHTNGLEGRSTESLTTLGGGLLGMLQYH